MCQSLSGKGYDDLSTFGFEGLGILFSILAPALDGCCSGPKCLFSATNLDFGFTFLVKVHLACLGQVVHCSVSAIVESIRDPLEPPILFQILDVEIFCPETVLAFPTVQSGLLKVNSCDNTLSEHSPLFSSWIDTNLAHFSL